MDACSDIDLAQAEDENGLFSVFSDLRNDKYWLLCGLAEKTGSVIPEDDLILGYVARFLPDFGSSLKDLRVEPPDEGSVEVYGMPLNQLFVAAVNKLLMESNTFFLSRIKPLLVASINKNPELKSSFCSYLNVSSLTKNDIDSVLGVYQDHDEVRPVLDEIIVQEFLGNPNFLANNRIEFLGNVVNRITGGYDTFWHFCGFNNGRSLESIFCCWSVGKVSTKEYARYFYRIMDRIVKIHKGF